MDRRPATLASAALAACLLSGPGAALAQGPVEAELDGVAWNPCPDFMPEGCGIAVLHGDPSQPNADIFFRLPAGAVAPRHWHTSPERMVLVRGEMIVDYDGEDAVTLSTGDYAYGPAEHPHSAECVSEEECVLFIAFEEPVDAFAGCPP